MLGSPQQPLPHQVVSPTRTDPTVARDANAAARMFQQPLPSYVTPSRIMPLTPSYGAKGSTKYNRFISSVIGPETHGMCLNIP